MSAEMLDFDQIETYLACPQKWEYTHALEIRPEENTQSFNRRGKLLRIALLTTFNSVEGSSEAAAQMAINFVDRQWDRFTDDGLYLSDRQEEFDKSVTKRALQTYLENYWDDHLSSAVEHGTATGIQVAGRTVKTGVDLLSRQNNGHFVVYDYVPTLRGITFSHPQENKADQYLAQEEYSGGYISSILRAELAIRGVSEDQDVDTNDVSYVVVGLHESVTTTDGSGIDGVAVEPELRDLTEWHSEYSESNHELLEATVSNITQADTTIPESWRSGLLQSTCRYCEYKDMCKPRFNWGVEF